uniref:Protein FAR1-RELATED SEQUENCE n=1 Tax=Chenopodium quinoa TaxID=63459 RepID=A0A803LXG8_CHEQI
MGVDIIDVEGGNMRIRASTDNGDAEAMGVEVSPTGVYVAQDEVHVLEPHVGMEFESESAAKTFYDDYARRTGFSTKICQTGRFRPDSAVTSRQFVCTKEGLKRRPSECEAMLKIELKGNKWAVTKFVKEHNHALESPSKLHSIRPHKHFAGAVKNVAEVYQAGVMVPSGVMYVTMDGNHVSQTSVEANRLARSISPLESSRLAAVSQVLPKSRHRINKSHILREGQEKLAHVCHMHPNFQAELYNCVNLTETIEEFESSWDFIIDKYDLRRNDWLQSLYNARRQWVPVYFRDTFFAAVSPNQGVECSFFDGYVNQHTTLPMFFRQYERAMEYWFEKEIEADFDTISNTPVLSTPSPMEKQAADLYTRKIFTKFQDELVETFVYTANRIDGDGDTSTYRVAKFEDDHKAYTVTLNISDMRASCSCLMFEYSGILCRHILTVFTVTNVLTLPPHYILRRWTRNAKSVVSLDEPGANYAQESTPSRYNSLCREAVKYAEEGATASDTYTAALTGLKEGAKKIAAVKKIVAKVVPQTPKKSTSGYVDKNISAADSPLLWPRQDEVTRQFNLNDSATLPHYVSGMNLLRVAPTSVQRDDGPTDNMVVLPCLKSMTWVMESKNSTPANRVAVINLKLQDYSKSPAVESEVKFQLSTVTLEPMLKSMAQISEQLSTPANRVAVINLKACFSNLALQDTETISGESEVKFQVSRDTLGAMLRSMAYIREQLSVLVEAQIEQPSKKQRK